MSKEKILLASNNQGKITEFLFYINHFKIFENLEIVTLDNFPSIADPEESKFTFTDNASLKSFYFYSKSNLASLSDDSGFIVNGSENFPGVKTARYAKDNCGIAGAIKRSSRQSTALLAFKSELDDRLSSAKAVKTTYGDA